MTNTAITTDELLDKLNTYTGPNVWEIICGLGRLLDDQATEAADPHVMCDVFVLTDGRTFRYIAQRDRWEADT